MTRQLTLICILMTFILFPTLSAAAVKHTRSSEEAPIITIKSEAYDVVGPTNSFGIILGSTETDYFDIDAGFGLQELEIEPWTIENGAITGTYKTIQVSEEGLIRIYGDPEKIDMIQLQGGYVTEIEMNRCKNLEVLDLSHNTLKALDLTPFTNLYAIYLSDNPFTKETPLKIGAPKNRLAILEIDIVDHLDQSFNLSDYPSLQAFDAYHNLDLWNIDPTGCPELLTMCLELTNVSTLDVSKNPKLVSLNISDSRIADIDLSNNHNIATLMAEHSSGQINTSYHLNGIDLSNLPNLSVLYLGGNKLKEIDLSKNPNLVKLNLWKNNLSSLDLSGNPNLYSVTITDNDMDFATLPEPQETWGEYFYLQNAIRVSKSMEVNSTLDLSSRVLRPDTETTASVWIKLINGNDTILAPELYSYADGKISFKEAISDSIFVKYANSMFPEYQLSTTAFVVKKSEDMGKPTAAISIIPGASETGTISAYVGMAGADTDRPVKFYVDFGDGIMKEFNSVSYTLPESANITGSVIPGKPVTIYVPEEEALVSFGIEDFTIDNIDVCQAHDLQVLKINKTGLKDIDLRYNRCLQTLNLDNNDLTELDLEGLFPNWEKTMLSNLSAAYNNIDNPHITLKPVLKDVNLKGNSISEMSLKDFDAIKKLDLSDNKLSGELSLTYLIEADTIILSGNRLNRIVHDTFANLALLDIRDNCFDIETLPYQPGAAEYLYAPQKPIEIFDNAPAVNLTSQNRVLTDGIGTTFIWKKADGTPLVEGTDITCTDGATRFLKEDLGKVYCELTNPAFPELKGNNVLRTTEVNVVGAPTVLVASFTTLEDSETGELIIASDINTSIYVDWRGDGSEFIPYAATKNDFYNSYDGLRTYKNANVKVYTYDDPTDLTVFSIYGMKMGEFDGTPMTGLTMISVNDAGLDLENIKLPEAPLTSLKLTGNNLSQFVWFDKYPHLQHLDLIDNKFETFDASKLSELTTLYLGDNRLTEVKFDNPAIWELDLENNNLEAVDLSGLKVLSQLWIDGNRLSEIDVLPFRASLGAMNISNNRFTFATLPVQTDYPRLNMYFYADQQPVDAIISDDAMTYDLSSQALVKNIYETTYTWFLGEPVFDPETGAISGEVLIEDDEYTISGGVTQFHTRFPDDVVCVMTNDLFPRGYLRTPAYRVGTSAVDTISGTEVTPVDVYTISGAIVKRQVNPASATEDLPAGIYIVGGRKVFVR